MLNRGFTQLKKSTRLITLVALIGGIASFHCNSAMAFALKKRNKNLQPTPKLSVQLPNLPNLNEPQHQTDAPESPEVPAKKRKNAVRSIGYLLPQEIRTFSNGHNSETLKLLSEEFQNCGFTSGGPVCLDSQFANESQKLGLSFIQTEDSYIFVSSLSHSKGPVHYSLSIEVTKNPPQKVRSVVVYEEIPYQGQVALPLPRVKAKVLEVTPFENSEEAAASMLKMTNQFKSIYHLSYYLLYRNYEKYHGFVFEEISRTYTQFSESMNPFYQISLLGLLRKHISQSEGAKCRTDSEIDLLTRVAQSLLNSDNTNISDLAALTLIEENKKTDLVIEHAYQSFRSPNAAIRELAGKCLPLISQGPEAPPHFSNL